MERRIESSSSDCRNSENGWVWREQGGSDGTQTYVPYIYNWLSVEILSKFVFQSKANFVL